MRAPIRTILVTLGLAPVLVLGSATPAAADVSNCQGVAPVRPTCSTSGTFGSSLIIGTGPNLGFTGSITVTVTSPTMWYQRTDTYQASLLVQQGAPSVSGGWLPGQSYTLSGSANGTGHFTVRVESP